MLLTLNLDSAVWVIEGVKHQEGEHEGRKAMHKICTALNKEKGIASLTKSVTILNSKITIKCCRYYKSHAGLCQDVSNAQKLRRIRACSESPRVRMAKPDFSPDEAKIAGNTLCINENFGKIWRERCKPDVRGEILNRL